MNEMIERIARALYDDEYGPNRSFEAAILFGKRLSWDEMLAGIEDGHLVPYVRDAMLRRAAIAIEAMRKPEGHLQETLQSYGLRNDWSSVLDIWDEIIDSAIKD